MKIKLKRKGNKYKNRNQSISTDTLKEKSNYGTQLAMEIKLKGKTKKYTNL